MLQVPCGCLLTEDVALLSQSNVLLGVKACLHQRAISPASYSAAWMSWDFPSYTCSCVQEFLFSNPPFCESYKEYNGVVTLNVLNLLPLFAYYSNL